jgi:predicted amidophosphoribosyltransferase
MQTEWMNIGWRTIHFLASGTFREARVTPVPTRAERRRRRDTSQLAYLAALAGEHRAWYVKTPVPAVRRRNASFRLSQ